MAPRADQRDASRTSKPTNPAATTGASTTPLLAEAQRLDWQVLLTVTSPVPRWATSNKKAPYVTRPDDQDFKEFMTAVGPPLRLRGLALLDLERAQPPGLPAAAVQLQRHAGLAAHLPRPLPGRLRGPAGRRASPTPQVLFGETAPTGYDIGQSLLRSESSKALLHDVAPLAFLREALCLNSQYRKSGSCGAAADDRLRPPRLHDGGRPATTSRPEADNVTIGVLSRPVERARTKPPRAHAIPAGLPIYLTEFGVQSHPNKQLGVPVAQQAEYDAMAEQIAYNNPRVAAFSQYLLKDDPLGGEPGSSVTRRHGRLPDRPRVRQRRAASRSTTAGRCR